MVICVRNRARQAISTVYHQKGASFAWFSSHRNNLSSRNPDDTAPVSRASQVEKSDFEDGGERADPYADLGISRTSNPITFSSTSSRFDHVCNEEEQNAEDSEEEEGDDESDEEDFAVLELFNGKMVADEGPSEATDETHNPLVRETCRLLGLRRSWNPKLESELKGLLRTLKPREISAVLRRQADMRVAASFFYWADRQWRYRHAPEIYHTMLELLSKTRLCMTARRVMRLMIRRRIPRRAEDFGWLMLPYSRAGRVRAAMRVLGLMQKDGCEPNSGVCNVAINCLVVAKCLVKAEMFLKRMSRVGIAPTAVSFNCLVNGLCEANRVDDALKVIAEMASSHGCSPDRITYCTVMNCLCRDKRVSEVRILMEKMMKDSHLLPDHATYNALIHTLAKNGHADEALVFLRESENKGFHVDKKGFSAVVHSFCQNGRIDEAKDIVNEMFSREDCSPDVVTYSTVLNGYCRIGKMDLAWRFLNQMHKHGYKPNTVTYTAYLNGLCMVRDSLKAREMLLNEEWWTPNSISYSVVIHGLRREGKLTEACELVVQMIDKGFSPTPTEINLLIHGLCAKGKVVDAKRFMETCQSKGCTVNVVNFTTVIQGFCRKGDLESVLSLLDDMYLSNKHPDVVTYTTIINALGKKGRIQEATALCNKMLHRGFLPSPVTYRIVIHRYCENGGVRQLTKLLDKMLSVQVYPNAYNEVIEKLLRLGKLEDAYHILGKVLRTASRTDARTCHLLMECYLDRDMPSQAFRVACRMFGRNLIPDKDLCWKVSKSLVAEGHSDKSKLLMLKFVERGLLLPQHLTLGRLNG